MRALIFLLCIVALISFLASCDGSPPRDVAYYMANDDERAAKIAQCDKDPGNLGMSPNCVNAHTAQVNKVFSTKNRRIPSIGS